MSYTNTQKFAFSSKYDAQIGREASHVPSADVASDATQTSENTEAALVEPPQSLVTTNHDQMFSILDNTSDVSMFLEEEELKPSAAAAAASSEQAPKEFSAAKPDFSSDTLPQPLRDEANKLFEILRQKSGDWSDEVSIEGTIRIGNTVYEAHGSYDHGSGKSIQFTKNENSKP